MTKDEQNKLITDCAALRLTLEALIFDLQTIEQDILHSS